MSVGNRAARGAIWNVGASVGTRALGLIGTLYMTRLLNPDVVGEVGTAYVIAQTANWVSHWGFNQYLVVHGGAGDEQNYHASVLHLVFALIGLGGIAFTGGLFESLLDVENLGLYLPGLTLSIFIRRIGAVPDKVLARELRFRELAIANGAGEIAYTAAVLFMASTTDLGGQSIVLANILQSSIATGLVFHATGMGWFRKTPWRWERVKEIVRFGIPLGIGTFFNFATRNWDAALFAKFFGAQQVGYYRMAYSLADVPAVQIGEQLSGVLLPAMTNLSPEDRRGALIRSTALMALLVFPLAVGLGCVAPTLIRVILNDKWQGVAPLLSVLSVLSVVRPMAWGVFAYLGAFSRTREIMILEGLKVVLLFGCIAVFAPLGPLWTAASVGVAFGAQSLITMAVVVRTDAIPAGALLSAFLRPLAACAVMALSVIGIRESLYAVGVDSAALILPIEILVGVIAYILAAFAIARATTRDFLQLLRRALKRG